MKVAFISCVNDEQKYDQCLASIKALHTGEITVETVAVRSAETITAGYNKGLRLTDAKYKVYLHQDVQIINPNFLADVDRIFQSNHDIGLIGMYGLHAVSAQRGLVGGEAGLRQGLPSDDEKSDGGRQS